MLDDAAIVYRDELAPELEQRISALYPGLEA